MVSNYSPWFKILNSYTTAANSVGIISDLAVTSWDAILLACTNAHSAMRLIHELKLSNSVGIISDHAVTSWDQGIITSNFR